ncbi:serine hydrolase [Actinomadura flavalba]|uniref:serine hydrolase n=1 Tax=Actinomadura flavalba TaxID=1120938 RepID=UPI000687FE89|nr:serine hydrolase [Actinomadura flavalba]
MQCRSLRAVSVGAVAGAVLAGAVVPAEAAAGPCVSAQHPKVAAALGKRITAALAGRAGVESVAVYDRERGLTCAVSGTRRYDAASVVKVTILGAVLRRAQDAERNVTVNEARLARAMITRSDNDAASALWRSVGRTRMASFLKRAGMTRTVLGEGRYWGLTQITAADQLKLLKLLTADNAVLQPKYRTYALKLMNQVVPEQRWGTPAGKPPGTTWHVKDGWLPRYGRYWRVHSVGAFTGPRQDYGIVVLTRDTPTMAYGVATIERVSRAVHRSLNPDARYATTETVPPIIPWEQSDGSVPPHV